MQLHLCRVDTADEVWLPGLLARLTPEERTRAERFAVAPARLSYAAAHALLHHALDEAIGPGWSMVRGEQGKPALAPPFADLHFNLTHADGLVAVAINREGPIGVDVEAATRAIDVASIGRRVFAAEERGDPLRLWTLKEAVAKATGLGLSLPFNEIVFDGDPPRLARIRDPHGPAARWWVHGETFAGHWLALAAPRGGGAIERVELRVAELAG
ncbi:4'-phosphopantetheinyl transferase family protein [Sphingomonas sp. MMS12-HWE2-04]|uniref:4'-phosphopantetheinyl transferase family protein n=1 Tax=Sphingomonas sp. MMS12-HWE2-04 TaxID=3234199 RepID=UPI00385136C0